MNIMNNLVRAAIVAIALGGCVSLPTATYTTASGCGIAQWKQQWVQSNVESMSWTGPCESGLAQGSGTLLVKLNNGTQRHYVGEMDKGFVHGAGVYTQEGGWKFQGKFLWLTFTGGQIFNSKGQLVFDGLMAHNEKYNGRNITFNDQRYHRGKLYFSDGSYIDDGRYSGSAGSQLGVNSIDPKTGKGIEYGKYIKGDKVIARFVGGKRYKDDLSYVQAQGRYYERLSASLSAENAAAEKAQELQKARERREAINLLGSAAGAAAAGNNAAERRQLFAETLAKSEGKSAGTDSPSAAGGNACHCLEIYINFNNDELLKNICDYEIIAPHCLASGSSRDTVCGTDKLGNSGGGYGSYIDARGAPHRRPYQPDSMLIRNWLHNTRHPDEPFYNQPPRRLPWSYGAVSKVKFDAQIKASGGFTWNTVKTLGWVCSENRQPATKPPGMGANDKPVRVQ